MKQLLCDLGVQLRGHNLGYIQNIIKLLNERAASENKIVFLFNSLVKERLSIASIHPNVTVVFITDVENQLLEQCKTVGSRRAAEWKLIKQYAKQYNIDEVLILELDQYQISVGSETTAFGVSGIYFRPHYRIEAIGGGLRNRLKYFLWRQKKLWLELYMCRNKNLRHIFILNDQQAVDSMNRTLRPVFRYLPDPILSYEPAPVPIHEAYKISTDRQIFLIFGAIDERKNIENLIAAFGELNPQVAAQATLLVVGTVKASYKTALTNLLSQLRQQQPKLQIVHHDQFVSNNEMESLFRECGVPLLVYRDFFVSSGLLGQAARNNKPVLVSEYGVMAELVKQYGLGRCVSPKDVCEIAEHLTNFILKRTDMHIDGQPFFQAHTPEKFLTTLLSLQEEFSQIHA